MDISYWPFCIRSSQLNLLGDDFRQISVVSFKKAIFALISWLRDFSFIWRCNMAPGKLKLRGLRVPNKMGKLLTDIFYTPFVSVWREINTFNFFITEQMRFNPKKSCNILKSLWALVYHIHNNIINKKNNNLLKYWSTFSAPWHRLELSSAITSFIWNYLIIHII